MKKPKPRSSTSKKKSRAISKKVVVEVSKFKAIEKLESLSKADVLRERNRIYQLRHRLNKKITQKGLTKDTKRKLHNELARTTVYLNRIRESVGGKVREIAKKRKGITVIDSGFEKDVAKWDASGFADDLINGGAFNWFVVNGSRFKSTSVSKIMFAIDMLETEMDLLGEYVVTFTIDPPKRIVRIYPPF